MPDTTNFIDTLTYNLKANLTITKTTPTTSSEDGIALIIFIAIFTLLAIIPFFTMSFKGRLISQEKTRWRACGEVFGWLHIIIPIIGILIILFKTHLTQFCFKHVHWLGISILLIIYIICSCIKLKRTLCKSKKHIYDAVNHYIQLIILITIGIAIIAIVWLFGIKDSDNFVPFSIFAALLGWIFQDTIQGVVAYFHLRANGLLHIGDWIQIPELNIDGVITDFSLITVTVNNWDTTTSNVAIYKLQVSSFKNNQKMLDGKTEGRRMYRSFIIDSRSISALNQKQIEELKEKLTNLGEDTIYFPDNTTKSNETLNLYLYRAYLRNWLTNHHEISHTPRLIVRIMDPAPEGVPIQIYAFIRKYNLYEFELVQSEISEHAILSMGWFGLRLYQKPTSKDFNDFVNIINSKNDNNENS